MPTMLSAAQILDAYFLETRAKLIEIAANLDRVDRAPDAAAVQSDPRLAFVRDALKILQNSPTANRAEQILRLYSLP
jgi:hypothetical protein